MSISHWGPHFPDAALAGVKHWSIHFPDGGSSSGGFDGYGPPGAATFVLDLESGFRVTYQYRSPTTKHRSGTEQRRATLDAPKRHFAGTARLGSTGPRFTRARLARFAAQGSQFLLGLPHEAMTLVADSSGTSVFVNPATAALCDWTQVGQRVVGRGRAGGTFSGVIQSSSGGTLVLDSAPGAAGVAGGWIMPALAVFLEPQQDFARYPKAVEDWQIAAVAAIFDFAPARASLALTGNLAGIVLYARAAGLAGDAVSVQLLADPLAPTGGQLVEGGTPTTSVFHYKAGTTTLTQLAALFAASSAVQITGSYTGSYVLQNGDAVPLTPLSGAQTAGPVGTGATLTTYAGHPVWDRGIANAGTNTDGIVALTELIDQAAVPYSMGHAATADWHRTVRIASTSRLDWQWLKLMLSTLRGAAKAFWLATWRDDFTWVSSATNTITVRNDDGSDIYAWYPNQRTQLQVKQADGTITRAQITGVVDNGNGTSTLTIGTTLSGSAVTLISWLELVRFEGDTFEIDWVDPGFAMQATARAVQS